MGVDPVKFIVVSMLLMICMSVVFSEVTESLPPIPPHHFHSPAPAPIYFHHHKTPPPVYPPSHHHHHKGHPPVYPPTHHHHHHPPSHAPSQPPIHPPSQPPHPYFPKRSLVAVQGVVYCKSCKYKGIDTLFGAAPLLGAVVKLECNNTKYPLVQEATTDKNGYFFLLAPKKITTYGAHKCKVLLVSSPLPTCNKATDFHSGLKGAGLMKFEKPPVDAPPPPFALFSVGPFAFEPATSVKCPP